MCEWSRLRHSDRELSLKKRHESSQLLGRNVLYYSLSISLSLLVVQEQQWTLNDHCDLAAANFAFEGSQPIIVKNLAKYGSVGT